MSLKYQSRLLEEAFRRVGVEVTREDPLRMRQPGVGVWYAIVPPQDRTGRVLVYNKKTTVQVLAAAGVPAARNIETEPVLAAARSAVRELGGFPVVVKPNRSKHAVAVTVNIRDHVTLAAAVDLVAETGRSLIVEQHLDGVFHRAVVARGQTLQVLAGEISQIVGDGIRTVQQIVDDINDAHLSNPLNSPIVLHPFEGTTRIPAAGEPVELTVMEAGQSWNYRAVTGHDECERVAAAAANACGLVMATVEMVHTEAGPVVFEVNARSNMRKHILADPTLVDRIVEVFS